MVVRARTEQKLLDAADSLLFTGGIVTTPVDRILELAGVSPATLYRAYGSKEGLVAAALERRHRAWKAVWDDAVDHAGDDRARLLAVFDALETFHAGADGARWCAFLGTAAEYADPPAALAAAVQQDTDLLRTRLTELAEPVVGAERSGALAESLLLLFSGELAMRLRDDVLGDDALGDDAPRDGGARRQGDARALAGVVVDAASRTPA